ncbi:MAG: glycosyltransferase [Microgenomates group bacterium]
MNKTVTCIVPFLNEKERIGGVLKELVQVPSITQIICVDGASIDGGSDYVKSAFPTVELITLPKNIGKTGTVKAGMEKAVGDYILLFDADLSSVKPNEVEAVLHEITTNPTIDMVIFNRTTPRIITKLNRFDLIYSGERVMKKADLALAIQNATQFQLEIALNTYMMRNKKNIYYFDASHTNLAKSKKLGFLDGVREDVKMFWQVCSFDPWNYFAQTLFFCRNKMPTSRLLA